MVWALRVDHWLFGSVGEPAAQYLPPPGGVGTATGETTGPRTLLSFEGASASRTYLERFPDRPSGRPGNVRRPPRVETNQPARPARRRPRELVGNLENYIVSASIFAMLSSCVGHMVDA
jgi:hypothetical protein